MPVAGEKAFSQSISYEVTDVLSSRARVETLNITFMREYGPNYSAQDHE